ncbi:hypothetical protein [Bradyrhizobium yuanmingense]|uniref:hypothetical protein n=1 Tax=Bradyrhizobium yuanmingense TaxID=108015 RepID=UPI0004B80449|nr:hypothetical protein [Bradyrhizobium yuanmingense]
MSQHATQHVLVGKTLLAAMDADDQQIVSTHTGLWVSEGGQEWVPMCKMYLAIRIELACRELDMASSTALIYETRKWIERQPQLFRNELPQPGDPW